MDPVTELGAEHVVNKLVLGDAAEAGERRALDDRLEVVTVAGDIGTGSGIPASMRSFSSSGETVTCIKRSESGPRSYTE